MELRYGRNYLNDEKIISAVEKYVDESLYDYAVMIDGSWGCGKTYFVKNRLIIKLRENEERKAEEDKEYKKRNVIYTSLYGVKSISDISKKLCMEAYLGKNPKIGKTVKKGVEIVSSLIPIAFEVAKPFIMNIGLKKNDIGDAIKNFLPIKNSILVFDDLERCDCPINEILGYINSFVEHEKMKVIIVANQEEIGKTITDDRRELRYMVAVNNRDIDFEAKNEPKDPFKNLLIETLPANDKNSKNKQTENSISLEQLEEHTKLLFGKNLAYERIREKLIGITLYYSPDLKMIMEILIDNSSMGEKIKTILMNNVDFFIEYMTKENHMNIRTFQFFLSKINSLYNNICKIENKAKDAFFNIILQYCFKICVNYRAGSLLYKWESKMEYGEIDFNKNDPQDKSLGFRFVDDFIMDSSLDAGRIERMIWIYSSEFYNKKSIYDTPLYKLDTTWHTLSDEDAEKLLEEIITGLGKNEYELKEYIRAVSLLVRMEKIGFSSDYLAQAVVYMKENLKNSPKCINFDEFYYPRDDEEVDRRTKEILKQLNLHSETLFKEYVRDSISEIIEIDEGWGEALYSYVLNHRYNIQKNSGFLARLDVKKLIKKILSSKSGDIYEFRSSILCVYENGALGEEGKKMEELFYGIFYSDKIKLIYDKIKLTQLQWLLNSLYEKIVEHRGLNSGELAEILEE